MPYKNLYTYNYGVSDYNTRLIADKATWLNTEIQPDILILYVGVNDILNQQHYQTLNQRRKNRENTWVNDLVFASRLLTGVRLFTRPLNLTDRSLVSEVPVEDARENLLEIMKELPNTKILLVPEMIISSRHHELKQYDALLQDLAEQYESLFYYQPLENETNPDQHLSDRNHLTRPGNRWLGQKIANELYGRAQIFSE